MSFSSESAAPLTAGTAISRLKPTAQVRESPSPSAAAIVSPLRLTPGKRGEHLGDADEKGVEPGGLRWSLAPVRPAASES